MELVVKTYALAARLPPTERFGLVAQIRRAAVSIPSNVAEGQASGAGRRYAYHARVALGSLAELETQVEIAQRLGWLSTSDVAEVSALVRRTGQLLHGVLRAQRRPSDVRGGETWQA